MSVSGARDSQHKPLFISYPKRSRNLVALTFDDGPNTTTTVEVLDKLAYYGVVASFYVCGNNINEQTAKVIRRAFEAGHEICNHSRTHAAFPSLTKQQMQEEIAYTSEKVQEITGERPRFFRPPYIAVDDAVLDALAEIGLPMICGFGSDDWNDEVSIKQRAERILEKACHGAVILLHDMQGNDKTVAALDIIIPELLARGYEFVTTTELFARCGIDAQENNYVYTTAFQTSVMHE